MAYTRCVKGEMSDSATVRVVHLPQIDERAVSKAPTPTLRSVHVPTKSGIKWCASLKAFWQTQKNVAGTVCVKQMYGLFFYWEPGGGFDIFHFFFLGVFLFPRLHFERAK